MNDNEAFFNELRRDVERDHRTTPDANAPRSELWQTIRAQVASDSNEKESPMMMTNNTFIPTLASTPSTTRERHWIARYTNIAATIAMVAAIAFAGWIAAIRLNAPGGGPDSQFAILGQTDGATCEVEPLTVDRVMDIVRNPNTFVVNGPAGEPTVPDNPDNPFYTGLQEPGWWDRALIGTGPIAPPTEEVFDASSEFVNAYLDCLMTGTMGQMWTFSNAIEIQADVLSRFPVFAMEEEVLASVESRISSAADEEYIPGGHFKSSLEPFDIAAVTVNPDPELALQQRMWWPYEYVVTFGVSVEDVDGETIYLTTATGNEMMRHPSGSQQDFTISVGYDAQSNQLVILPLKPLSL